MKKITRSFALLALMGAFAISCEDDDTAAPPANENDLCLPTNLQAGLIAYYPFSEGSLQDRVGSANLTASSAQPAADRQGNAECAYSFVGSNNSYLTSQNTQFLNGLNAFSVALWYKPQGTQAGYELLLGRDEGLHCPDTYGQWSVGLHDVRRAVFGHGGSVWEDYDPSAVPVWKFVTVTCNKANNAVAIYVNGVLQDSETGVTNCGPGTTITVEDIGNLLIGKNFNGSIDDIAIYNKVLTQAEINQLHDLAPCCD